jgi:hypothetical protein
MLSALKPIYRAWVARAFTGTESAVLFTQTCCPHLGMLPKLGFFSSYIFSYGVKFPRTFVG